MAENEWIYDANYNSWFYLDENGHYVENTWKDQYYLKSGGYMAKNEWIFDSSYNSWYYFINATIRMHTFGNLKMYKIDSAVIMILR